MYLLFDIGGTKTRLAITRDKKNFVAYEIFDTPNNFDDGVKRISEYVVAQGIGIQEVVGGIAGVLDDKKSALSFSPNLQGWLGADLKSKLSELTGAKSVTLENDATLSALGEAVYGVGKDFDIVGFLTISTGVGGARVVDKKIDRSVFNFEPGHQIIKVNSMLCSDDLNCKCDEEAFDLENFISGAAIEKKYGQKLNDLTDEKIWDSIYHYLAIGLVNVCVFWSPEIIILGGGVTGADSFSIPKLEEHFKKMLKVYTKTPIIKKGVLGDHSGLYGALHLVSQS